jgi:hypothetical protein
VPLEVIDPTGQELASRLAELLSSDFCWRVHLCLLPPAPGPAQCQNLQPGPSVSLPLPVIYVAEVKYLLAAEQRPPVQLPQPTQVQ